MMSSLLAISVLFNVVLLVWVFLASHDTNRQSSSSSSLLINEPLQWNGGHPLAEQTGNCYCNAAKYCMCTPSLAIDLVILSGNDHVWLVRRKDTNQLATMGGFVQVGETVEAAVRRELMEEMGMELMMEPPVLLGVYSDPRRDFRRHTVSVAYAVRVPADAHPVAADDVKQVHRVPLADLELESFFADHKTILTDFRAILQRQAIPWAGVGDFANDIVRSVCDLKDAEWMTGWHVGG